MPCVCVLNPKIISFFLEFFIKTLNEQKMDKKTIIYARIHFILADTHFHRFFFLVLYHTTSRDMFAFCCCFFRFIETISDA